ncbi:MAG: hypothetical protein ABH837_03170 [bacterium]
MNKMTICTAVAVLLFCLIWDNPVQAATNNYITEYHSDGYYSFEWYQEHENGSIFPDIYRFQTPDNYREIGIGAGQVFPWREDYSYGCVLAGYLAHGNYGEWWLEPGLIAWGEEENWGFNIPIFQYFALNDEAYNYTFFDEARVYLRLNDEIRFGMSSVVFLDSQDFTEDHGHFLEFDTKIGTVRVSYRADEFEINLSGSF